MRKALTIGTDILKKEGTALQAVEAVVRFLEDDPQFNAGRGYGRYINDLASEGGQDAYFDPDGNLRTPRIASGYIAFQHWWAAAWRSSFIASFVDIKTYDWQDPNAYDHTTRVSANLIWSPHPRIDLGSEVIWGKRTDRNDDDGDASQVQVSAKYRF